MGEVWQEEQEGSKATEGILSYADKEGRLSGSGVARLLSVTTSAIVRAASSEDLPGIECYL